MKYEIKEDGIVTYQSDDAPRRSHVAELLIKYGDGKVGFDASNDKVIFRFMSRNYRELIRSGRDKT